METFIGFKSDLITDLKWIALLLVCNVTQGYHDYHSVLTNAESSVIWEQAHL